MPGRSGRRDGLRGARRSFGRVVFALYTLLVLALVVAPAALLIALARTAPARWRIVWGAGRFFLGVVPIELRVTGRIPATRPLVVACNHASMLDGIAVILALRGPQSFVVAGRFETVPFVGGLLRRLGVVFVHRTHSRPSSSAHGDVDHLTDRLHRGDLLVVFPEGSLGAHAGIRPFHHGAFLAAARSGTPVVPVALRGTRAMLPPGRGCRGRYPSRSGSVTPRRRPAASGRR